MPSASVFRRLAAGMEAQLEGLADATLELMTTELPAWAEEPALRREARAFARESIRYELQCLGAGRTIPDKLPPIDLEGARRGARAGYPLSGLLDGYRAGHRAQWDAWLELVEAEVAEQDARLRLLREGSAFFFDYAARLAAMAADEYTSERDRAVRSAEQRRVMMVTDLLEGRGVKEGELGYPLQRTHVGLVASGPDAAGAVRAAATALDAAVLVLNIDSDIWWGWVGLREGWDRGGSPEEIADALGATEARIGIGSPSAGRHGFRRTHLEAGFAHRAATLSAGPVRYRDVALESIAGRDAELAAGFVVAELSGLNGGDRRSQRLRATLTAYFRSGDNAKAAAADLGLHQQTVGQRLRTAEERLGHPIAARRAELETALRLRAWLSDDG